MAVEATDPVEVSVIIPAGPYKALVQPAATAAGSKAPSLPCYADG